MPIHSYFFDFIESDMRSPKTQRYYSYRYQMSDIFHQLIQNIWVFYSPIYFSSVCLLFSKANLQVTYVEVYPSQLSKVFTWRFIYPASSYSSCHQSHVLNKNKLQIHDTAYYETGAQEKLFVLHNWTFCTSIDRHFLMPDEQPLQYSLSNIYTFIHERKLSVLVNLTYYRWLPVAAMVSKKSKKGLWFLFSAERDMSQLLTREPCDRAAVIRCR